MNLPNQPSIYVLCDCKKFCDLTTVASSHRLPLPAAPVNNRSVVCCIQTEVWRCTRRALDPEGRPEGPCQGIVLTGQGHSGNNEAWSPAHCGIPSGCQLILHPLEERPSLGPLPPGDCDTTKVNAVVSGKRCSDCFRSSGGRGQDGRNLG